MLGGAQVMKLERNKVTGKLVQMPVPMSELSDETRAQLEDRLKRRKAGFLLEKSRGKLETLACSVAFFASGGNLLAPYAASVLDQAVFSALQRVTQKNIMSEMERELQNLQRESLAAQSRAKEEVSAEAEAGAEAPSPEEGASTAEPAEPTEPPLPRGPP